MWPPWTRSRAPRPGRPHKAAPTGPLRRRRSRRFFGSKGVLLRLGRPRRLATLPVLMPLVLLPRRAEPRLLHHRLVLLRRELPHLADEGHDVPDLVVGVGDAERGHAGHLDAVLDHPEGLLRLVPPDVGELG